MDFAGPRMQDVPQGIEQAGGFSPGAPLGFPIKGPSLEYPRWATFDPGPGPSEPGLSEGVSD